MFAERHVERACHPQTRACASWAGALLHVQKHEPHPLSNVYPLKRLKESGGKSVSGAPMSLFVAYPMT